MSSFSCSRRRFLASTLALAVGVMLLPGAALAEDDFPTFYATIVGVAADHSALTLSPTKDQSLLIDVRELGREPWDNGAFALDNVILLRTKRLNGGLVATGWEQARDGSDDFNGVERRRDDKERNKSKNDEPLR